MIPAALLEVATSSDWRDAGGLFTPAEFRAPRQLSRVLLRRLVAYRARLGASYPGASLRVSSDARAPGAPVSSGGRDVEAVKGSWHYPRGADGEVVASGTVLAVDVVPVGVPLVDAYLLAERFSFGGIGLYYPDRALHLDVREDGPARWARWGGGKYRALDSEVLKAVHLAEMMRPGKGQTVATANESNELLGGVLLVALFTI